MILTIAESIKKQNIEPINNIIFIGTVGEEGLGDLRGVRYLFKNKIEDLEKIIHYCELEILKLKDTKKK